LVIVGGPRSDRAASPAVDVRLVGRELDVRHVLTGSVRREGDRITAHVQMTRTDTGAVLWSERFEYARVDGAIRDISQHGEDTLHVFGKGLRGLVAPGRPIDCANSGTLVRLLSGILAGQQGQQFELTGDASLSSRPMKRITEPLGRMGAGVETDDGHLPLGIEGRPLRSITYELPVASAQVKSAILLAGLYAKGETTVVEPQPTRDHTELMLEAAGATIARREKSVTIQSAERLEPVEIEVPGDFSSAAPFIVAATLVPGSELHIHGVNLNPRRTGLLTILERMGGRVTVYNRRRVGGERVGDLEVRSAELVATTVLADEVPLAIDELPLFALAASCAHGNSRLRGAEELRAKESDRVEATVDALRSLGQHVFATEDGFRIRGVPTRPRGGKISSRGDHRIAMLGAIAALDSQDGVEIEDAECVAVSFPGFFELLSQLRLESNET
jgi:3-phosphoshikimate 1-carboxyvinyltransferase